MTQARDPDVFTTEVVRNGLGAAALEMSRTLARTARSTLLYDVQDFGVGIMGHDGSIWAEAPGITLFTSVLSDTVRTGLDKHGAGGFRDGDVLIVNDPYLTGTHVSDTSIYMPVWVAGDVVAFTIATAHWADVGAKAPGGWCPDSTDVYQEGLCFTHQKLVAEGRPNEALWEVIASNVRFPATVRGDLEAQIAACRVGVQRVQALCEKYGKEVIRSSMARVIDRTESMIREEIRALEDGLYSASVSLDFDGVRRGPRPRVQVNIRVAGDELHVSWEGSSDTTAGPINLPPFAAKGTAQVALKAMLAPLDRTNEGHFRPITVDLSAGRLVTPERPAPVDSYGYLIGGVGELVLEAMAQLAPHRARAGGLQLLAIFLYRTRAELGPPFMFIEPVHGGQGATPDADGATLARFADGDASNTAAEVIEMRYPLQCERFELRCDSGGPGRFRGGLGLRRDYRIVEDGVLMQTANENTMDVLTRGRDGGEDGGHNAVVLSPDGPDVRVLSERVSQYGPLAIGEVVSLRTAGGGGYGVPWRRDPEAVAQDVRDGFVSEAEARERYGVVTSSIAAGAVEVDRDATAARREEMRNDREGISAAEGAEHADGAVGRHRASESTRQRQAR